MPEYLDRDFDQDPRLFQSQGRDLNQDLFYHGLVIDNRTETRNKCCWNFNGQDKAWVLKFSYIILFDVEVGAVGGPSFTAAIPGVDFPLGLCLAEAPDLVGAMSPCPSKGSVCQDHPVTIR